LKFIHDFISILFDEDLSFKQKLNLLVLIIFTDNKKPVSYNNIICHFGDFAYYVCKVRDLGFIEGPISVVFHGYELSKYKEIEKNELMYKKVFLKANLMLPISNLWKKRLISWGCDEKKIIVHHMGIDIDKYYFRNDSVKLQKPLKVLQVGRLTYKKAILDSIEAIHQVSKFIPVSFTIIGDGELFNDVQAEIKKRKLENIIKLLGPLSQDDVLRYLVNSDIFLLPSVTALDGDMEGIPVAIMEAMAMGLIVLSTFHSGIPELVEHEYSGFLVEEHDPSMIAHTLLRISNLSTQELSEVRNNARNKCVEDFNNFILNKKIIDYFR
jgi:colanic acid/amylovoran biosynthesis glycosyltransferase